jgi:hypothetical protein
LFAAPGEYHVAVASLRRQVESRVVPDGVFLELYAYELLQRTREEDAARGPGARAVLVFPFWPLCLFAAAGIRVHAARELESLLAPPVRTLYVVPDAEAVAAGSRRVLGDLRFDPQCYLTALAETAARCGWTDVSP